MFAHISNPQLRTTVAETFYGARWIYKLGLALLVKDAEQMAHVRAQVLDYGAVCEGLLSDALFHGVDRQIMVGQKHRFNNLGNMSRPINWNVQNKLKKLTDQNFYWHIEVAADEAIITQDLADKLHKLRLERNSVHLRARTQPAFIGRSKHYFEVVIETCNATRQWKAAHP